MGSFLSSNGDDPGKNRFNSKKGAITSRRITVIATKKLARIVNQIDKGQRRNAEPIISN